MHVEYPNTCADAKKMRDAAMSSKQALTASVFLGSFARLHSAFALVAFVFLSYQAAAVTGEHNVAVWKGLMVHAAHC
jgi:hypothetical protein